MDRTAKEHCIKIYTGLHAGTELPLDNGNFRVGGTDDCDIILEDCCEKEDVINLMLDGDQIVVRRENGQCLVEGTPLNGDEKILEKFSLLTLGNAHFAVGPNGETWPPFEPPQRSVANSKDEKNSSATASAASEDENQDDPLTKNVERVVGRRRKFILAVSAILILLIVLSLNIKFEKKEKRVEKSADQLRVELEAMLSTMPIKRVSVTVEDNGELVVTGMLRHRNDERQIVQKTKAMSDKIALRLDAADEILPLFETVLENYNLKLGVTYHDDGRFILQGFARDEALVRQIVARLQNDLPAVGRLEVDVQTHDKLIPEVFEDIEKLGGIQGRIEIQAHTDYIRVSGELLPGDRGVWNKTRAAVEERYGPHIKFQERFTTRPLAVRKNDNVLLTQADPSRALKQIIGGLTYGYPSYVITKDGRKFFEGAMVNRTYKIEKIMPDKVIFRKNSGQAIVVEVRP